MPQKYGNFIPRKVYRCPCLTYFVNQIHDANIRSYQLILDATSKSYLAEEQVFSLRIENKTSCMLLGQAHLILTLLSETKFECTSQSDSDFLILALQIRYCKSCIKHYCENMCEMFSFKNF